MRELEVLRASDSDRQAVLLDLYKNAFPMVAKYVANRGGTFDQARDIFHDALVLWWEKSDNLSSFISSDKAYLFGISRHMWLKRMNQDGRESSLEGDVDFEDVREEEPSTSKLLNLMENTGRKCLDLLKSFYYDKLNMSELAEGFGFKTVRSATVQKYKCLEKVREIVKEKSLHYEDFVE